MFVVRRKDGELVFLEFPTQSRAIEYIYANYEKLNIKKEEIKRLRLATKEEVKGFRERIKRSLVPAKTIAFGKFDPVNSYLKERGELTFDKFCEGGDKR
jgi:hypothetical protein